MHIQQKTFKKFVQIAWMILLLKLLKIGKIKHKIYTNRIKKNIQNSVVAKLGLK